MRKNNALRPDGEARTRLAQACIRAGRIDEARQEMQKVLETRWTSAESFATAAVVYRLVGDPEAQHSMEARAKQRNPHALEGLAWLKPASTGT